MAESPKVALIFPPTADPTAPYLSVPALASYLRAHGVEVVVRDANVEAWTWWLTEPRLGEVAVALDERVRALERRHLSHELRVVYVSAKRAQERAREVAGRIAWALAALRDKRLFLDPQAYGAAVSTVDEALTCVGGLYAPLELSFSAYRTPFGLLSTRDARRDSEPSRFPFHEYFHSVLIPQLQEQGVGIVGVSMVFPGQILPAYALGFALRERMSEALTVVGGPAFTQLAAGLGSRAPEAVGPFHCGVLCEGERALLQIVGDWERGRQPPRLVVGDRALSLDDLPAPDFEGLPLGSYLSPEPVLPYDQSRGCYWGRCAFCHYGLAFHGTAPYRHRRAERVAHDLEALSRRWGCRIFYLSHDGLHPGAGVRLARALAEAGRDLRWGTDMRPERALTRRVCALLRRGGALSVALGVESGSDRVLQAMDKGVRVSEAREAILNLASEGVAVEAMCFVGFPGETFAEAMETVHLVESLRDAISLFIIGEFGLVSGSRVAREPRHYGIRTWRVAGDELGLGLFYEEVKPSKTQSQVEALDEAIRALSRWWTLRRYPWAGSLSTAHSLIWYEAKGPDAFRVASPRRTRATRARRRAWEVLERDTWETEARIWDLMVRRSRRVSRSAYRRWAETFSRGSPGSPRRARARGGSPRPRPSPDAGSPGEGGGT